MKIRKSIMLSDDISETYITQLDDGRVSICHCDNFGIRSDEELKKANEEAFKAMLCCCDDDQLEEARKVNNCNSISDLFNLYL